MGFCCKSLSDIVDILQASNSLKVTDSGLQIPFSFGNLTKTVILHMDKYDVSLENQLINQK